MAEARHMLSNRRKEDVPASQSEKKTFNMKDQETRNDITNNEI